MDNYTFESHFYFHFRMNSENRKKKYPINNKFKLAGFINKTHVQQRFGMIRWMNSIFRKISIKKGKYLRAQLGFCDIKAKQYVK